MDCHVNKHLRGAEPIPCLKKVTVKKLLTPTWQIYSPESSLVTACKSKTDGSPGSAILLIKVKLLLLLFFFFFKVKLSVEKARTPVNSSGSPPTPVNLWIGISLRNARNVQTLEKIEWKISLVSFIFRPTHLPLSCVEAGTNFWRADPWRLQCLPRWQRDRVQQCTTFHQHWHRRRGHDHHHLQHSQCVRHWQWIPVPFHLAGVVALKNCYAATRIWFLSNRKMVLVRLKQKIHPLVWLFANPPDIRLCCRGTCHPPLSLFHQSQKHYEFFFRNSCSLIKMLLWNWPPSSSLSLRILKKTIWDILKWYFAWERKANLRWVRSPSPGGVFARPIRSSFRTCPFWWRRWITAHKPSPFRFRKK